MTSRAFLLPLLAGLAVFALGALGLGAALAAAPDRLNRLHLEETELTAEQTHNLNALSRLLSVLVLLRRDPPPALLVSPDDAKDAVRAAILVKAMTPELQQRASGYARLAHEVLRERRLAAVESEALFTAESARAEAAPEPGEDPVLPAARQDIVTTPPRRLIAPVGGPMVRRFGEALPSGGKSNGLALAAAPKVRVVSPDAGRVQYVGPVKGWGEILILRLAGGYHLVLAGMERTTVSRGQSVAAGEAVGWMPDGRQSSVELYLEVRDQGAPLDPRRWLGNGTG